MDAFEKIKEIFRNVPEMLKCCFASTFIVGLIVHLFAFTNMWFISDAAFIYYPAGSTSGIGGSRYLVNLTYLALENIQLPWMAGILEMIIYSFASYYTCRTLNIRHNITAVFIAALMISSPTAIASNTLLSGVLQFSLALFTSVLAAWYLDQGRIGCFMSVLMILIMFGLYGGYIGMTASLLLLVSIRKILEKQDVKSVFLYDVKAVFSIVFGLTGSYAIVKILSRLTNTELQQRVSGASNYRHYLDGLIRVYEHVKDYFVTSGAVSYFRTPTKIMFWIGVAGGILFFIYLYKRYHHTVREGILLMINLCLLPLGMSLITVFMSPDHDLVKFSYLIPWIMMLMLYDMCIGSECMKKGRVRKASYAVVLCCTATLLRNWKLANIAYMKNANSFEAAVNLSNRIVERIESQEGYEPGVTPVLIIGNTVDNYGFNRPEYAYVDSLYGAGADFWDTAMPSVIAQNCFIQEHLHVNMNLIYNKVSNALNVEDAADILFGDADSEEKEDFINDESFSCFPDKSCVKWVNGTLVIKLSEPDFGFTKM